MKQIRMCTVGASLFAVAVLLVSALSPFTAKLMAAPMRAGAADLIVYGDSLASGWQDWSWSDANNLANASPVHAGTASIAVSFNGAWGALSLRAPAAVSTSGYTAVTFWVHGGSSGTRSLIANIYQTDAGSMSTNVAFSAPAGVWTPITLTISALGNPTAIARINIQDNSGTVQPTFYVDDMRLAGTAVPLPVDGTIRINTSGAPITVDSRMRGSNLPAWLGASRFADPVFRARTVASGLTLLRMPGGSYSDSYGWLSCEMGANQTNAQPCGSGWETWVSKPTDFLNFIKATGMAGMWVVNPNGTPQEAAAAVAFFNATVTNTMVIGVDSKGFDWKTAGYWAQLRSSHGNPGPIGMKLWAVGNEVYGGTPASGGAMCQSWGWENSWTCDGAEYVNGARGYSGYTAFRSAMRAIDTSIQVGAVGNVPAVDYNNFGNKVVSAAGSVMDYYDIHIYGYSGMPASLSAALAQPVSNWPSVMADVRSSFTANAGGRQAPIAVTEYNMFSAQDYDTGQWMTRAVNALYMADTMGQMIQNGVVIANQWDLANGKAANGTMYDLLQVDNAWYRGPQYYVAPLWARFGSQMLPITNTFDAATQLSVYGGRVNGTTYSLLAINKSAVSVPATISLESTLGALGITGGTIDIVQASSLNDQAVTFNTVVTPSDNLSNAPSLPLNLSGNVIRYSFAPNSIVLLRLNTGSLSPTATATFIPTVLATATPTNTRTPTAIPTALATATPTNTRTPTATPAPTSTKAPTVTPAPTCTVKYAVTGGTSLTFTASLTFTNQTGAALNGWTLTWTFGGNQTVTSMTNATSKQTGSAVTATNTKLTAKVAKGASQNIVFAASYSGVNGMPSNFALNGKGCQGN